MKSAVGRHSFRSQKSFTRPATNDALTFSQKGNLTPQPPLFLSRCHRARKRTNRRTHEPTNGSPNERKDGRTRAKWVGERRGQRERGSSFSPGLQLLLFDASLTPEDFAPLTAQRAVSASASGRAAKAVGRRHCGLTAHASQTAATEIAVAGAYLTSPFFVGFCTPTNR